MKSLDSYDEVRNLRLYQDVAAQVRRAILSGELRPGDQLPGADVLAQQFRVSRVVIREAIQKLRHDGMVEARQGRGVFVTVPSIDVVVTALSAVLEYRGITSLDLHQVRQVLEVEIAGFAAEKASEQDRVALNSTLEAMKKAADSPEEYIEHDLSYHSLLATATGNPVFPVVLGSLVELLRQSRLAAVRERQDAVTRSLSAHEAIQRAIEARSSQAARDAMREHLREVATRIQAPEESGAE